MEWGDIWAVIVSINHRSVTGLVKQSLKIGILPEHIVVVTNVKRKSAMLKLGVLPENILKKGRDIGYAGALIKGMSHIMQYDTGAITINLSSEFKGNMLDKKEEIERVAPQAIRSQACMIGSINTEDGIGVWRAEAIHTPVITQNIKRGAKFGELTAVVEFATDDTPS